MLHALGASFAGATPARPPARPPIRPWDYLRMRRKAAGLSIDDVATALSPRIATRAAAAELVRLLETRHWRAKETRTLVRLADIYPFDPGVYRQLVECSPAEQPPICQGCGASYWDQTRGRERVHLDWAAPVTCSGCVAEQARAA